MKNSLLTKLWAFNRMTSQRRSKCSRNTRKQMGGGAGSSLTFAPGTNIISNSLAYAPVSNCQAAVRPGVMDGYKGFHGLPGMRGGSRKSQRGGGYSIIHDGTVAGYPGSAGIGGISNTGCSAPSQTAIPASGAADNLNSRSSYLWSLKGGAVGSDLAQSITVPTASYSHLTGADSVGTTSAGTKFMINVPGDGRAASCMNGGSRKNKKSKSKSKKSKSKSKSKKSKSKSKKSKSKSKRN